MSGDSPPENSLTKKRLLNKIGMGLDDDFRASCGKDAYVLSGKNTTPKRKVISSKPNLFVKRRENISCEDNESSAQSKLRNDRLLGHLQEHLQMRNDGNEDNSIQGNPHALMKPTSSIVDHLGLDLTPTLQNVVSTVNLGCILDLQRITFCTRMSEYNPSRFSGVVMRIREPHTTALVFKSGKVVVTGAKTEGEAHLASRKYGRIIQKLGFDVKFLDFKIQNIVGTYDLKFPLRVENLNQVHGQFCRYEPELFPGLIYRLVKPRVVLLIFVNGKIVLTGARNRSDLKEALQIMYPVLKSFKKDQERSE